LVSAGVAAAQQATPARVLGSFTISTGFIHDGIEFGGISGLTYDAKTQRWLALSDDRAEKGPARFYDLAIDLDARGIARFEITKTTKLTDAAGAPYAAATLDPEEIALLPNGNLVWADEGTPTGQGPALVEMTRAGRAVGTFDLPSYYKPGSGTGVRDNLGHEGLAVSPDGTRMIAVIENALAQDGPIATVETGSPSRVLVFDLATRRPVAEHVYVTEKIPTASPRTPPVHDNGVAAATYLRDGRLIVVERSFALGVGNTIHIFEVDLSGATNVLGRASIAQATDVMPVTKKLLWRHKSGDNGLILDNMEAIAQGPDVDGVPTVLMASDNNFNRRGQITLFLALQLPK
jgi:hypothetical protein